MTPKEHAETSVLLQKWEEKKEIIRDLCRMTDDGKQLKEITISFCGKEIPVLADLMQGIEQYKKELLEIETKLKDKGIDL